MKKRFFRTAVTVLFALVLIAADIAPLTLMQTASAVTQAQIDALKKEQSSLKSEKSQLQSELKTIQNNKSDAMAAKANIDRQITVIREEIRNAEEQIAQYEELIAQTERELQETEEKEAAQRELFRRRVRDMEERGTVSYWSVLFHSASFADLLSSMDFISEIMESDQRVIDDLRELERQIEEKKATLESSLAEQKAARDELAARNQELNEQLNAAQRLINDIVADEAAYKKLIAEKEAEEAKQRAEILRLSRELAAQQQQSAATLGGYIWPCASHYVTSPLGARYTGIPGASTNHAGIDIGRVYYSSQVYAAKAGTVIVSGYNRYRGNYVVVSHGSGNTTTYQHLSKRSVNVGDKVKQGQVLGITGSTGVSRGPHLHFEIMENGQIVNPLKYLTNYTKGW